MYSMVIIVNNNVLYTWNLLRVDLKSYHTTHTHTHSHSHSLVTMGGDGYVN